MIAAELLTLLREIRDLLRQGARRPLGPHSYLTEEEAAAETGHGLDAVRGALPRSSVVGWVGCSFHL